MSYKVPFLATTTLNDPDRKIEFGADGINTLLGYIEDTMLAGKADKIVIERNVSWGKA